MSAGGHTDGPRATIRLPNADERATHVGADRDEVWSDLVHVLRRSFEGVGPVAWLLGCDPAVATAGFAGLEGQTLPGFRVVDADPGRRLTLRGRHRFSEYELTFLLEEGRLRARTDAAFPVCAAGCTERR